MNIFVGSLNFQTTEDDLQQLFSEFGTISSVKVIMDNYSNRSKGFGFVEMPNNDEAQNAIAQLNGKSFMTRNIVVNEARPKTEGGGGFSRGGGSRGGGFNRDRDFNRGERDFNRSGDREYKKKW